MAGVRQVGWGFIGTSGWVASRFAPAVQAAGHRVAGGFGTSAEGSERFAERFGARPFAGIDDLLADDAVEAVWIASPTAQATAFSAAVAGAAAWQGATLADGVRVSELLGAAWDFSRNRARA